MIPAQAADLAAHAIASAIVSAMVRLKLYLTTGPWRSFLHPIGTEILYLMSSAWQSTRSCSTATPGRDMVSR
jgi:hypothetical protein